MCMSDWSNAYLKNYSLDILTNFKHCSLQAVKRILKCFSVLLQTLKLVVYLIKKVLHLFITCSSNHIWVVLYLYKHILVSTPLMLIHLIQNSSATIQFLKYTVINYIKRQGIFLSVSSDRFGNTFYLSNYYSAVGQTHWSHLERYFIKHQNIYLLRWCCASFAFSLH